MSENNWVIQHLELQGITAEHQYRVFRATITGTATARLVPCTGPENAENSKRKKLLFTSNEIIKAEKFGVNPTGKI